MDDSNSLPPPTTFILEANNTTDTDALQAEFDKFYAENEKVIQEAMKMDARSITLGGAVSNIELQIDKFLDTTKVVLDGLAGLGKIHPIIGAAVVAFHAVVSLDLLRRDNDRKVIAVVLEMQNMMCGMFELRHSKYAHTWESEKSAEKSGLHRLVEGITADITQCGSDLNYYIGRKAAIKLIKAKVFEQRFMTHVENFAKRRSELPSTITAYIGGEVDQANAMINTKLDSLDAKMALFEQLLRKFDTPQEKKAFRFFNQNNSVENSVSKDDMLSQLLTMTGEVLPDSEHNAGLKSDERIKQSRKVLTDEGRLDLEEELKQNALRYEKLLAIQKEDQERLVARLERLEAELRNSYHLNSARVTPDETNREAFTAERMEPPVPHGREDPSSAAMFTNAHGTMVYGGTFVNIVYMPQSDLPPEQGGASASNSAAPKSQFGTAAP